MLLHVLVALAVWAASLASPGGPGEPTYTPEPNPPLNSDPTDTSNPVLVGKAFPFDDLPEQADTSDGQRGMQTGFNRCNATTAGPNSQCQTLVVNNISDFCIWGPPTTDTTIGDTEEEEVAWCTTAQWGGRIIPPGTITGLQFIKTESYIELTGELDQTQIGLQASDGGGELDSGGQDQRGNPLGGLVYSNNLPSSNGQMTQSRTWSFFIGDGVFCFKACDPTAPDALGLCQHIYDTIGCNYNVPAAYVNNTFLSCEGEDQSPVGVYTSNGLVFTIPTQAEGAVPVLPYTPTIPVSSNCQTFSSAQLFSGGSTSTTTTATATGTGTSTGTAGGSGSNGNGSGGSGTQSSSGSGATSTGNAAMKRGYEMSGGGLGVLVAVAAVLVGAASLA